MPQQAKILPTCPELAEWWQEQTTLPPAFVAQFLHESTHRQACPPHYSGNGIVICADADRYGRLCPRLLRRLRELGCRLPAKVCLLPEDAWSVSFEGILNGLGATSFRADPKCKTHRGWALKPLAVAMAPWRRVLLLDADVLPLADPTPLLDQGGSAFFGALTPNPAGRWTAFGLQPQSGPQWDSGVLVVDKQKDWSALTLAVWLNQHADISHKVADGDAFTWEAAWAATGAFATIYGPASKHPWGLRHSSGGVHFEHRCWAKSEVTAPAGAVEAPCAT